jgi:hypothetical protein
MSLTEPSPEISFLTTFELRAVLWEEEEEEEDKRLLYD